MKLIMFMKKFKVEVILSLFVGLLFLLLFLIILPGYFTAKKTGDVIGGETGEIVGKVIGSYEGTTNGIANGTKEGEEAGKSAKDIKVASETKISQIGKLEVLTADLKVKDVRMQNGIAVTTFPLDSKVKFAELYIYKARCFYSIDLNKAQIERKDNDIVITFDKINTDVRLYDNETENLASWGKNGSAEDGATVAINSRNEIQKKLEDEACNNLSLLTQAEISAKKQLELLVKNICGNEVNVEVVFNNETK